jgi:hypothetical protein
MARFLTCSIVAGCALVAACSKAPDRQDQSVTAVDVREAAAPQEAAGSGPMAPPGIMPNAAPGVAFNYRYAFVLPSKSISAVQESHAGACEKLGITRCRITGMRYTLHDEDQVTGQLSFKLAPELARGFGKEGITAVEKAAGRLVDAAIEGTDVGTQITASQRRSADLQAELSRIEARLAAGGIGDRERAELTGQAQQMRQQLSGERQSRSEGEDQLANTPMTFNYTGDESFTLGGNPVGNAAQGAWDSLITMIAFALMAIGVALPWLALLAVLLWAWRSRAGIWLRGKVRGKPAPDKTLPQGDEPSAA